jgi:Co/Zn/Cd efflux system component
MFLDCSAIFIGLICRYLGTLSKNNKYNFGYARSEVVGTFINSIFLIFISIYIVFEAISRSIQPKHSHGEILILNSFLRLFINLVGIYLFMGLNVFQNEDYTFSNNSESHSHNSNVNNNNREIELSNLSSDAKLKSFDEENNLSKNSGKINIDQIMNK